jgi:ribonuclease Y
VVVALVAGLIALLVGAVVVRQLAGGNADRAERARLEAARADAEAIVASARLEAAATARDAETAVRAALLDDRSAALDTVAAAERTLDDKDAALADARAAALTATTELDTRQDALDQVHQEVQSRRDRAAGLERDIARRADEAVAALEQRAAISSAELSGQLRRQWLDAARSAAAAKLRAVNEGAADPAFDREAKRTLEIASARYQNHFLTERNVSNLRVGNAIVELLLADGGALHAAVQKAANVQLIVSDDRDAVRLDGLDGVGKEVARRALAKLEKKPESIAEAKAEPEAWAQRFRDALTQEIRGLGKKAFQVLGIPKAHPEIVELVGALNYRTSYTQNQWLHAVEASFLAGMMAAELGLDEKLARRATLMHDIGKALTHQIEGSHAVIGADIARRVGEAEIVANAIGAHHADEPCNSVYAYLVAAADAMSGARPGARREMAEGFSAKVEDLERIGLSRRGVDHAHAVHGGRELRVYVREREVDDLTVVELSTDIAAEIADTMTFPGQIKVTVIRSFEAVSTAS